jgi:anti-sigma-K factor RskA
MMTHDEAVELLAPLALDALDSDAQNAVEEHVLTCARCQSELDGLREVASAMGNTFEPLPEGLWTKISSRLYEREGADANLVPALMLSDFDTSRAVPIRGQGFTRRAKAIAGTIALAAAAAIIALGVSLSSANSQVVRLQLAIASGAKSPVLVALATPGHKVVTLSNAHNDDVAKFVTLPDGRGYLLSSKLPALSSGDTYQLWGIVNGSPVSIGVMGRSPTLVTFTMASSPAPSALAVSVEPAGGSSTPARPLVATGTV